MAGEKSEHVKKMKKMEAEMEQVFEMKVKEKMLKLKESEADVSVTREMFPPPRETRSYHYHHLGFPTKLER